MRLEVDNGSYTSACSEFYDVNHGVVDLMSSLTGSLGDGGGMAGTDTGGAEFAAQYDEAAASLVQAGCDLGDAMANVANLLNASLVNHDAADHGALVNGPPEGYGNDTGDTNPDHWTSSLSAPAPPSAAGGIGGEPGWWHWIASHLEGLFWPDADTGRLRSVGNAWVDAGSKLATYSWNVDSAAATLQTQRSPEIPDAVATCQDLSSHVTDLADAFTQIGNACSEYADQVDAHHEEIEHELASFIEWTIAIEAGGAILGALTLGIGEGAAQAAEGAEVANAASKVVGILRDLVELARLGAARIGQVVTRSVEIADKIRKILRAKVVRALEVAGVRAAKVDLETLPAWALEEATIPGTRAFEGFTDADRYGGLTKQEFFDKYWDAEKGGWRYPENDGFLGDPSPNSLQVGQRVDRFGPNDGGFYASPAGESYGSRAIPPSSIGRDYHEFEVLKPLPGSVKQGEIAPWFEQPGGGTQYLFDHDIDWYISNGYLKELH
ncbi:TNT domain-containing protein [Nocardioides mangrovi]|uniref:TNT domain-containing protein n=1 Tax=Nocardioides mangrovi TaxID=2874580 RepID=A0ABS7UG47_9ACTN|nr:TNT domain-containing protein [Nocardioides mangrovi]MBZ5739800.1 TNT domain-containing protein [Nocardioides mangrovi]